MINNNHIDSYISIPHENKCCKIETVHIHNIYRHYNILKIKSQNTKIRNKSININEKDKNITNIYCIITMKYLKFTVVYFNKIGKVAKLYDKFKFYRFTQSKENLGYNLFKISKMNKFN